MLSVRLTTIKPMATNRRNMHRWMKEGLWKALVYWHKHFLRFHFTMYAYARYGGIYKKRPMRRRRGGWAGELLVKSMRPLYETGVTRALAMSMMRGSGFSPGSNLGVASGLPSGPDVVSVQGRFKVPNYLRFIRKWGYDPHKELTTVNQAELRTLARIAERHLQSRIDTHKTQGIRSPAEELRAAA